MDRTSLAQHLKQDDQNLWHPTQPAWLLAHSDAMDNHAIHRGIWIRERLLGGAVPDVSIDVDAMLPDEATPLRHRMRVTQEKRCWTCHESIDPLGLPFEMYNRAWWRRAVSLVLPLTPLEPFCTAAATII